MEQKIKLSFVNNGKPFVIPHMTVKRQEEMMEEMVKLEKKLDGDKFNREMNKVLVLKTLQIIDKDVTKENIDNMHPDDYIELFTMIWDKGRELSKGEKLDFRKTK
jgi:hypothetical protein